MINQIKIAVVDDHHFYRRKLVNFLNTNPEFNVIYDAENGLAFLDHLNITIPDITIIDVKMPVLNGIETIKRAMQFNQHLKFIALTMYEERDYIYKLIDAGAKGIMFKNSSLDELVRSILEVHSNNSYFSYKIKEII